MRAMPTWIPRASASAGSRRSRSKRGSVECSPHRKAVLPHELTDGVGMKVLLVCLADFRAPGARQTLRLAEALSAAGAQCMVLIEGDPEPIRFATDPASEVQ